jgi:4-diphosphocytidyl-2-C-methyl-D-erythritol kinase
VARRLVVQSRAKINWLLRIVGRRGDGFHELETIFQPVSLADRLTFERAPSFRCSASDPALHCGEENLVVRAWRALESRYALPPVSIHVEKAIPAGGGLGGGSSNAAATMLALVRMFELEPPPGELEQLALELGSDVPFFLFGGTAWATGRGEVLARLPSAAGIPLIAIFPEERVSTPEAFRLLAKERSGEERMRPLLGEAVCRRWTDEGLLRHAGELTNDLERVSFAVYPHLDGLREMLRGAGAVWARMSGSGSTLVGAFDDRESRDAALQTLRARVDAVALETVDEAVVITDG